MFYKTFSEISQAIFLKKLIHNNRRHKQKKKCFKIKIVFLYINFIIK